ncbi:MAG: hypothetical protein L0191_14415, partial [Acidobacteria bacterium]|nr:hypothetical protein [Acidobacteriota bacterium]
RRQMEKITQEIDLVTYVDDTYVGYYCLGPKGSDFKKELRVWEHRMPVPEGQAPVVLIEGFTTGDARPEYRWKSLIEDVRSSLIGLDIVQSKYISAVVTFFSLTILHGIKQGGPEAVDFLDLAKKRPFKLGGTNFKLPGETIDAMGAPQSMPDASLALQYLDQRINRALPPILSGDVQGVSSGYQFDVSRRTALTRVRPLAQRLAQADADIMRMICYALGGLSRILRKKELKVYVRESTEEGVKPIGVSWEQVRDLLPLIRAKREENFPEDIHSLIDAAIKAHKELGLPWAKVIEKILGWENPEELKELRAIEDLVASPVVLEKTEQDLFREMELILNEEEGMPLEEALGPSSPPLPPGLVEALGGGVPDTGGIPLEAFQQSAPAGPIPFRSPAPGPGPNVQTTNPRRGTRTRNRGRRKKAGA